MSNHCCTALNRRVKPLPQRAEGEGSVGTTLRRSGPRMLRLISDQHRDVADLMTAIGGRCASTISSSVYRRPNHGAHLPASISSCRRTRSALFGSAAPVTNRARPQRCTNAPVTAAARSSQSRLQSRRADSVHRASAHAGCVGIRPCRARRRSRHAPVHHR